MNAGKTLFPAAPSVTFVMADYLKYHERRDAHATYCTINQPKVRPIGSEGR